MPVEVDAQTAIAGLNGKLLKGRALKVKSMADLHSQSEEDTRERLKQERATHRFVNGSCQKCGASERAVKKFGWSCGPTPDSSSNSRSKEDTKEDLDDEPPSVPRVEFGASRWYGTEVFFCDSCKKTISRKEMPLGIKRDLEFEKVHNMSVSEIQKYFSNKIPQSRDGILEEVLKEKGHSFAYNQDHLLEIKSSQLSQYLTTSLLDKIHDAMYAKIRCIYCGNQPIVRYKGVMGHVTEGGKNFAINLFNWTIRMLITIAVIGFLMLLLRGASR